MKVEDSEAACAGFFTTCKVKSAATTEKHVIGPNSPLGGGNKSQFLDLITLNKLKFIGKSFLQGIKFGKIANNRGCSVGPDKI